jgi:TRAP transporter TAXI family solute receptor
MKEAIRTPARLMPLALSAALLALPGVGAAQEPEKPTQLTILSGSTGSSWYSFSSGLVPLFQENGIDATTIPGGGTANILRLSSHETEVSFGQTSANYDAQQGQGAFAEYEPIGNLYNLAMLSVDHVHVVCTEESGFDSWEDLPNARMAAPAAQTSSWGNFLVGLSVYGIDPNDLNIVTRGTAADNATALRDREVDCLTQTSAWPQAPLAEASMSIDLKIIGMDDDKLAEVASRNPGLIAGEIPAGAYRGHDETVKVYLAGSVLMTHDQMPDDHAYWIAKIIGDNIEQVRTIHQGLNNLTVELMADAPVWPMHPGAQRYYEEIGVK